MKSFSLRILRPCHLALRSSHLRIVELLFRQFVLCMNNVFPISCGAAMFCQRSVIPSLPHCCVSWRDEDCTVECSSSGTSQSLLVRTSICTSVMASSVQLPSRSLLKISIHTSFFPESHNLLYMEDLVILTQNIIRSQGDHVYVPSLPTIYESVGPSKVLSRL